MYIHTHTHIPGELEAIAGDKKALAAEVGALRREMQGGRAMHVCLLEQRQQSAVLLRESAALGQELRQAFSAFYYSFHYSFYGSFYSGAFSLLCGWLRCVQLLLLCVACEFCLFTTNFTPYFFPGVAEAFSLLPFYYSFYSMLPFTTHFTTHFIYFPGVAETFSLLCGYVRRE